jgi:hypothetical protein
MYIIYHIQLIVLYAYLYSLCGMVKQGRGGGGGMAIYMGTIQMSAPITLYQSIFKKKFKRQNWFSNGFQ